MNQNRNQALPDVITRSHLLTFAGEFDELGIPLGYRPSHSHDVEIDGKLYPPPAIVALAAKAITGSVPEPGFCAGKGTKCFQILEDAGFSIRRKTKHV
ncbi:hypothetical protein Pla22_37170 [Rubripirellula amarantea]|uniref:ScoMcrA-like N-terminal head domain-containing protein n=1 Tax=Rubripirellula amarantea TaxID=2527999 RepID=A0A5C5WJI3_9BACT|nr:hypothetical protein [Rubripirellula amarantea]TWT50974.1 hypothetical protein Pla22_37170 [Rubripirellula amarantea]